MQKGEGDGQNGPSNKAQNREQLPALLAVVVVWSIDACRPGNRRKPTDFMSAIKRSTFDVDMLGCIGKKWLSNKSW
jgi:hypothetical protein